ncbi:MAG: Crp/Fnr family transcriptional regulator [Tagaea sp.]|nr:cyclic nucleotide-binding domain-containing protein [Azospirillum sp.]MCA3267224.1 cyclic nucleotide-binding domain-containing protein [Azospirillum sp.]MCZ8122982.1 cyclic nucleotide-binding domain-containing protein [Magnetospirillum sp.]
MSQGILPRKHFAVGRTIFRAGDPGDAAYVIESGIVDIQRSVGGQQKSIAKLAAGEIFGEMALIDGKRRMADALAVTNVTVLIVPADQFTDKMRAADPFVRALLRMFTENLRLMTRNALIAQTQNENLRARLKELGADPGAEPAPGEAPRT